MEDLKKSSEAEVMDKWRKKLRSIINGGNGDVFEMIKRAIMVAASDHPTEFLMKRDEIAQILFSSHHVQQDKIGCIKTIKDDDVNNHGIIYGGTDDEVLRIKQVLDSQKHESDSQLVYESLSKLEEMGGMCFKTLEATKIGFSVSGFQNHASSNDIRQIARRLIKKWRCIADEWIKDSEKKQAEKQMVKKEAKVVGEKQMVMMKKESSKVEEKQMVKKESKVVEEKQMVMMKKEARSGVVKLGVISEEKEYMEENKTPLSIQRRLEETKRKLHQRYEEAETAKRQRKIKVIEPYQLIKKQKQDLILSKFKSQNTRIKI